MNKDFEIVFDKETQQKRIIHYTGGVLRNKPISETAPNRRFIPCIADGTIFERIENKLNKMGFALIKYFIPRIETQPQILVVPGTNKMAIVEAVAKAGIKADNIISAITENKCKAYPEGRTLVVFDKKTAHENENTFGIVFKLEPNDEERSDMLMKALAKLSGGEWNTFALSNIFRISQSFDDSKLSFDDSKFKSSEDEFYTTINFCNFYNAINDFINKLENIIDKIDEMFKATNNSVKKTDNVIDKIGDMFSESNNSSTALTDVNIGFVFHDSTNTIEPNTIEPLPYLPFTVSDKFVTETECINNVKDVIPKTIYPKICGESDNVNLTTDILNSAMPLHGDAINIMTIDSKITSAIRNNSRNLSDTLKRIVARGQEAKYESKYMADMVFPNSLYRAKVTIATDINTDFGIKTVHNPVNVKMCINKSKNLKKSRNMDEIYIDINTEKFFHGASYLSFMHLAYDINKIIWDNITNPDPANDVVLCDSNGYDRLIDPEQYKYAITHSLPVINHDLTKSNQFEINTKIDAILERDSKRVPMFIEFEFKTTIAFEQIHDDFDTDGCETV